MGDATNDAAMKESASIRDTPWITKKELLFPLPILGSIFAVAFDVGYFAAVDINLFNVFSVSEHITFALEILPIAILASIVLLTTQIFITLGIKVGAARARQESITGKSTPPYKDWTYYAAAISLIVMYIIFWWKPSVTFAVVVASLTIGTVLAIFAPWYFLRPLLILPMAGVSLLCFAFALGFDEARWYREDAVYPYTIVTPGGEIEAKVVRSGERGMLYYEGGSGLLVLLPWKEIKKITSSYGPWITIREK